MLDLKSNELHKTLRVGVVCNGLCENWHSG